MNDKVLFMIIDNEVKYLAGSNMDHREWYNSLGYDNNNFENIVRGYVIDNKIIFFKGSMFNYDEEVIKAACTYSPSIRITMSNPTLEVYCGIVINSQGEKWEPVVKINEDEITGFVKKEEKEIKEAPVVDNGPLIEFKNDIEDKDFTKKAILVTVIVLILVVILKVILFSKKEILKTSSFFDILLVLGQVISLILCIKGYKDKNPTTKYMGVIASVLIVFTFDIFDVIIGVLYFLFSIDQNIIIHIIKLIKEVKEKIMKKGKK